MRQNIWGESERLDAGVNFFVLTLEKLGARTEFSCEGHPTGFYIVFYAPISLAQKLVHAGFFSVELVHGVKSPLYPPRTQRWCIRLGSHIRTEQERQQVLTLAARSWLCHFGPPNSSNKTNASRRNN